MAIFKDRIWHCLVGVLRSAPAFAAQLGRSALSSISIDRYVKHITPLGLILEERVLLTGLNQVTLHVMTLLTSKYNERFIYKFDSM